MKTKKSKGSKVQSNQEAEKKPKCVLLEEWDNEKSGQKEILTNLSAERLAREMTDWFENNENAIKIQQYLQFRGIGERTWNRWCNKYQKIGDAHEYCKMIIGNRREVGIITRKFDGVHTAFMMRQYDKAWGEEHEYRANLKSKDKESGETKFIIMSEVADSPLVPKRKDSDE